uniref:Uncharacterized protein n=1 Tax=Caenorhabditis tropicalis TaxID=1561998 RepID=A0A1I7U3E0_9PELO
MPAILSRMESKVEEENSDGTNRVSITVIDTQPLPTVITLPEIPRGSNVADSEENNIPSRHRISDSVLRVIHEEHKNVCPVLCLAHLYIFLSGDTNWFIMALLQIGIQSLFFKRSLLQNPIGRRVLLFFSLTMMTSSIISLSLIREVVNPNAPLVQQLFFYCFFLCAFIGFVFTNMYNISLIFVFGRNIRWHLQQGNPEVHFEH